MGNKKKKTVPQPKNYIKFNGSTVQPKKKKFDLMHIIVLVLMVLWTVGFGLSVFLTAKDCSKQRISAAAEESVSTVADSGIDSTLYPSANLFYPDNIPVSVWNGRLVREGYSITAYNNTFASFFSSCSLSVFFPDIEIGVPYTFSCTVSSNYDPSNSLFSIVILGNSNTVTKYLIPKLAKGYVSSTVIFEEGDLEKTVYFYGGNSSVGEDFFVKWSNLTCNRGEVAYPFMPNLESLYNSGYDTAFNGVYYGNWFGSTVNASLLYQGFEIPYSSSVFYVDSGIGFDNVYSYYNAEGVLNGFSYIGIDIDFDKKFRCSDWSVKSTGTVDSMSTGLILIVKTYSGGTPTTPQITYRVPLSFNLVSDNVYEVVPDWSVLPVNANLDSYYIWSIEGIKILDKSKLLSFTLFSDNLLFTNGFNVGYNDGFVDGSKSNDSYNIGFAEGQKIGYNEGKAYGYNLGLAGAENANFYSLLTAVIDVPLNAFISLFDFNVLGVNLAQFFMSLFSLAAIITIVRMIM